MAKQETMSPVQQRVYVKRHRRIKPFVIVYYLLLTIAAIIVIVPFWWTLATSFEKITTYAMPYPPRFWPTNFTMFNYELVTINMDMPLYLKNTTIVAVMSAVLQVFTASIAGYVFSKGRFPGKSIILLLIMSNLMIPFETKLMPTYQIIRGLGLNNTFMGIVLPGILTNAFNIFMIKKYCDDLPYELLESGVVDGASKFRIYWSIYLPLMGPVIATLIVLTVMNAWSDLLWPVIVANKTSMYTVQVGLSIMTNDPSLQSHAGMATAASVMSILPLAIVFIFMQRYIVQSVAATGIKQ